MHQQMIFGGTGRMLIVAVWCGLGSHLAIGAGQQPGVMFRVSTDEAQIHATVVDRSGKPVSGLRREDFEVRVGGKPVPVTAFSNEPQAITAVVLIETTFPLADRFFQMRDVAKEFVDALGPGDLVRIGSFAREVSLSPWLSGDKGELKAILAEELWPLGGAAALLEAVGQSARSLSEERRPASVLVLGFGGDAPFTRPDINPRLVMTMEPLLRVLFAERVLVYGVRFRGLWAAGQELSRLARESGGGDIEVKPDADLHAAVQRIIDELRRPYLLGFSVEVRDDRVHRVEVRVPGGRDLVVRAPRGYVARPR